MPDTGSVGTRAAPHAQPGMPDVDDADFHALHAKAKPFSLLTPEKFYNLYTAIHYVCDRQVQGDIIECGVWKGGAMLMASDVLAQRQRLTYDLYLYDTFTGFVERSDRDINVAGAEIGKVKYKCFIEETKQNIALSLYPEEKFHFVPGDVRETLKPETHHHIAFLLLSTSTYATTLHELTALYDRIVTGGVLIIDDYGYSHGCRAAVDEFFSTRPRVFLQRTNTGARTAVKV